MKVIKENSGVFSFVAESNEELPLAIKLAHDQAISFRTPIWCDTCNEYHTRLEMERKHKRK